MPPPEVASLLTKALMLACPVVASFAGGCSVNAIVAGTVIVVVAVATLALSAELRL